MVYCRNYDDSSLEELGYHVGGDESTDQNNNITMTSEDLLQPGHVVKERWKVVSRPSSRLMFIIQVIIRGRDNKDRFPIEL